MILDAECRILDSRRNRLHFLLAYNVLLVVLPLLAGCGAGGIFDVAPQSINVVELAVYSDHAEQSGGLTVVTPNGSEVFRIGDTLTISIADTALFRDIEMLFSPDSAAGWIFVWGLQMYGYPVSFDWVVPESVEVIDNAGNLQKMPSVSANCLVKVRDSSDPDAYDISDGFFSVQDSSAPVLSVLNNKLPYLP
ncbi:MAG: hypothetical protein GF398_15090 [Chitinivibrionales bacterium]|nr:hypothetical protein [Chitinivibrionales bacterium]